MPYSKLSEANPALRGIKPPISLAQANAIAAVADGIPKDQVANPWAVAISQFKKSHIVKDGKWVRKEGSEFGKKKKALSVPSTRLDVEIIGDNVLQLNEEVSIELDLGLNRGVKTITSPDGERLLVLWTANAFEDREKEIFETKSLEDYVARTDRTGERGRVWFWHVKGTDFADIVWQGVQGRFLLELAKPDGTEYATKMMHAIDNSQEFSEILPHGWGTSHGFLWHPAFKEDGVYRMMHKFETTVLPAHRASNVYGTVASLYLGGKGLMSGVTKEKALDLAAMVGEETAKELLESTMQATELLEKKGISFKEWLEENVKEAVKPTSQTVPPEEDEEDEEEDEEEMEEEKKAKAGKSSKEQDEEVFEMELSEELMKEIAGNVNVEAQVTEALNALLPPILSKMQKELVKAVKEVIVETNVSSKEEIVQQAISGKLRLTPYQASEGDGTTLSAKEEKELKKKLQEQADEKEKKQNGDVVSQLAARFMKGE